MCTCRGPCHACTHNIIGLFLHIALGSTTQRTRLSSRRRRRRRRRSGKLKRLCDGLRRWKHCWQASWCRVWRKCGRVGEGRKDKTFIKNLSSLKKFKYHTSKWTFLLDNASGGSPETILQKCCQTSSNRDFDIVICFIDLDKLKEDFPKNWEKDSSRSLEHKSTINTEIKSYSQSVCIQSNAGF